jgi:RND family efflux transporter MFP subunit
MKSTYKKIGLPILIIAIAMVVAFVMISSRKPPEETVVEDKAFLVEALAVNSEDITFMVKSQGTVSPKIQTVLSAQVSGRIVEVAEAFIEGGMFKRDDVLVQLESADYQTDLKLAEAELAGANAALDEERARGKVAEKEWKSVKNTVAPELGLRKPQLAKEIANVRAAEAKVERAKRNLERTSIKAPYDGLVKAKNVDIGQFVNVGNQLGTVYATDVAEIRMPLSDNDLAYLQLPADRKGSAKVKLHTKIAGRQVSWQAILARNEGVLDAQNRVVYAIAEVQDPYKRADGATGEPLIFGRFVQADITGNDAQDLMVLPRNVLRLDGTVLVVDKQRKLHIREVELQRSDEQKIYISRGLANGELVVNSAVPNPYDGMPVRLPGDEVPTSKDKSEDKAAIAVAGQ